LYGAGLWAVRAAAVIFLGAAFLGAGPWAWARQTAVKIGLKEPANENIIYEDETNYCYVAVGTADDNLKKRLFFQDTLVHSAILVGEPNSLEYTYEQIMAAITHRFAAGKDGPAFLILGGGGYVLPRYLERFWPTGVVDVVEIDPGVTKAAFAAFGLDPKTRINTISRDARNYVDGVIEQRRRGLQTRMYDFIYEDALNNYSVPYQLTTKEFNDKLYEMLADDGIYMVELIDTFDSSLFLGALVNTLEQTFPFVTVISEKDVETYDRNTYVVVAAKHKLDLADVCRGFEVNQVIWYLSEPEIAQVREKSNAIVLTDDYAPVENMLTPVVQRKIEMQARKIAEQAEKYAWQGNLRKAMQKLEVMARVDPSSVVRAYSVISLIFADTGRVNQALQVCETALDRFTDPQYREQILSLRHNYAVFLKRAGKNQQAAEQFDAVAQICNELIAKTPKSVEPYRILGNIFAEKGDFAKAVENFQKVLALQPDSLENHTNLIQALEAGGNIDSAVQAAQKAIEYFQTLHRPHDAENIRKYLDRLPH
jgi:spermidine synthase/Tfp pilus assembly protein PilF